MSAELQALHAACLRKFKYAADSIVYGESEYWVSPAEIRDQLSKQGFLAGDCDDFASLCVMRARAKGFPARFVFCQTETGEYHLVCEVKGWILDNRYREIMRKNELQYTWLSISGFAPGDPWHSIET